MAAVPINHLLGRIDKRRRDFIFSPGFVTSLDAVSLFCRCGASPHIGPWAYSDFLLLMLVRVAADQRSTCEGRCGAARLGAKYCTKVLYPSGMGVTIFWAIPCENMC